MDVAALLEDLYGRVREDLYAAVDGLPGAALVWRADPEANTIAWLIWHIARVQDDHVAGVAGTEQVWTADGWYGRFGFDLPENDLGYGNSSDDVSKIWVNKPDHLLAYFDAVHQRTVEYFRHLTDAELDRIVDTRWDPPVTLGVRLVSVASDNLQHAGQAAYLRGLWERRPA